MTDDRTTGDDLPVRDRHPVHDDGQGTDERRRTDERHGGDDAPADDTADRALGALVGLALGDALGMPTQLCSRVQVVARYGPLLDGLHPGPADHPIAADLPAGSTTDDTAQALLLAGELLAGGGTLDQQRWARTLLTWEDEMRASGSLDLLGPSTRAALDALLAGATPDEAGRAGTTNGAAMRVAPVGIATPADVTALVEASVQAGRLTHGTSLALAGAAAVAGAVSAGVAGGDVDAAVDLALACAARASQRGRWVAGGDVATRLDWAVRVTTGLDDDALLDVLAQLVGTSLAADESVPAAFALVAARGDDPWRALRLAASAGGDTDTIAAMTGAVLGAVHGVAAFPAAQVARLRVDHDELRHLAGALLRLRTGRADAAVPPRPVAPVLAGPAVPGPEAPSSPAPWGGTGSPDRDALTTPVAPGADGAASPRLVYLGQAVVDLVSAVPRLPERGGDVLAGPSTARVGGGATVLLTAASLGRAVVYAGRHGTGPHGDLVRAALTGAGVHLTLPPTPGADTGSCLVLVEPDGERTFVTTPGVEATLTAADLDRCRVQAGDLVVVSGYALVHPANRSAVLAWLPGLDPQVTVLVDPGPLVTQVPEDARDAVWARADWLSANRAEAAWLTGCDDPAAAVEALAASARGHAVLRAGADGCWVAAPDAVAHHVPVPDVAVTDLTGAGDVHTAAFADGLLAGLAPVPAAARANAVTARTLAQRPSPDGPGPAGDAADGPGQTR